MRTNIEIDDKLIQQAKKISGLKTKKEVVNKALREFVQKHNRKNLAELKGKIAFTKNYDHRALRKEKSDDTC